ncbi:hypothetical protein EG329_011925 [Mollisiaceae sp. DMI_Dod_QoI]|nr:hypothetical protein EG329_011925 [Helotiales sp. DMI_Dod_QoI]
MPPKTPPQTLDELPGVIMTHYRGVKVEILRGNITNIVASAIVNAANTGLQGGGGIDGSIHRAAGPGLKTELAQLYPLKTNGKRGETGKAYISGSHNIAPRVKSIVHAIGPDYRLVKTDEDKARAKVFLRKAYIESLDAASNAKFVNHLSLVFPCISTGIFGYPKDEGATIALEAIHDWIETSVSPEKFERIAILMFRDQDTNEPHYVNAFPIVFSGNDEDVAMEGGSENIDEQEAEEEKRDSPASSTSGFFPSSQSAKRPPSGSPPSSHLASSPSSHLASSLRSPLYTKYGEMSLIQILQVEETQANKWTGLVGSLAFASEWVKTCIDTHEVCRTKKATKSPTRLIEVYDGGARLFFPPKEIFTPYLTLSHCWGTLDILKLKRNNIDALRNDIPLSSLCKTFQQAIIVTKVLGFRYIWIDSLCIIQDDEEDWLRESATMADVYGNGAVNIAATHAHDGSVGLFGQKSAFGIPRQIIHTNTSNTLELWDVMLVKRCLVDAPLGGRAWAFQERFLSPRTIHFSAERIFCECRCGLVCEGWLHPSLFKPHRFGSPFPKTFGADDWAGVVHYYSRGQLTFAKDKLVALSGVARKFQSESQDQYCAGLWKANLEISLCWRAHVSGRQPLDNTALYHGPSWSWISNNHVVSWELSNTYDLLEDYRELDGHYRILIHVMDVYLVTVGPDLFGQLQDAKLTVKCCPLFNGAIIVPVPQYSSTSSGRDQFYAIRFEVGGVHGDGKVYLDNAIYCDIFNTGGSGLANFHFLPIHWQNLETYGGRVIAIYGLVLTVAKGLGKGYFVRIGVWDIKFFQIEAYAELLNRITPDHTSLMDEELYREVLGNDENGVPQYLITLV